LELPEDQARSLYLEAVADRLKPMVQLLANELERSLLTQQQLAQKTGRDQGQDIFKDGSGPKGTLGIGQEGTIMNNIMNLIDFYKENDIAETKTEGNKNSTIYPVTALGTSAIEVDMANALYRQFVVGGFTTQDAEQQARYEGQTANLGGILGLTEAQMTQIGSEIGGQVYENYIQNALLSKDALDQQDLMFLANLQTKLGLTAERGTELMLGAQKKVMLDLANNVFRETPTPDKLAALRVKFNSMGLDPAQDVGIPPSRLEQMFAIEVVDGIDGGTITAGNAGDTLTELQESLGLDMPTCERVLENLVETRTTAALTTIEKELLRGRDNNCVPHIQTLLKFAAFVGGDLDGILEVEEETAYKIVNIFDNVDFGSEDEEIVKMSQELLRTAVGLNSSEDDDDEEEEEEEDGE